MLDDLNSRPLASRDFSKYGGRTIAKKGDSCGMNQNVGYSGSSSCGLGFWPPGTAVCPYSRSQSVYFPLKPAPEVSSGLNEVNMISII